MATILEPAETQASSLPPGPRPLSLIGNILAFRRDQLGYRLELNPLITLRPKHGMPMILIPTAAEGSANSWEHLLHTSSTGRHEATERKGCLGALLSLFGV